MAAMPTQIVQATTPEQLAQARQLIAEYAAWLGFDLAFQSYEQEMAGLPGKYAPPGGRLLLAQDGGQPAGCAALRPLGCGVCEMKRLYVRPAFRARGVGRALAEGIVAEARAIGYARLRLDTADTMTQAHGLYHALGFHEIAAYYPVPETLRPNLTFFELELNGESR